MTSVSIGPYLRWKLKNLGFEYDPVEDTWFWGWKKKVRLNLDRSIDMFIWSASVVTAKRRHPMWMIGMP